jgi:probable rRNA maturation factor
MSEPTSEPTSEPVQLEPIQVEVNLEDYFFENPSLSGNPDLWQSWFCQWLKLLSPQLSPNHAYELSLRLTDDTEIQRLNAQYRQKNQPTDVLAFAALEAGFPLPEEIQAGQPLYLGDIVISGATAERQAQQRGHTLIEELAWLAAHALLHLLGWDHPDEITLGRMLKQQALLLESVGLFVIYD